jgi:cation-transporting ATPase I
VRLRLPIPDLHLPRVELPAPVRDLQHWLGGRDGRVARRSSVVDGHAHVEVRGALDPGRPALGGAIKEALERLDGVQWAEVDGIIGRAVVLFDPEAIELDDLIDAIEVVEEAHDTTGERFAHHLPDHPDDLEPIHRRTYAIAADVVGLGVVAAGQTLRLARIPAEVPGLIALADGQPRIRGVLERRIGPPATDMVVATANATAQALGQGAIGLLVDIGHHSARIGEQLARRDAWRRRQADLLGSPTTVAHRPIDLPPRPTPLPKGDIERYTDGAAIASLAGVGATFGLTRNPRRAADLVLAGVPKAATLGRELFASTLAMALSSHDILVMDPAALRRLDRVTTVVIDARLVSSGRWGIDQVAPIAEGAAAGRCEVRCRTLLDPADPTADRQRGSWSLRRWRRDSRAPRGTDAEARRLRHGGRLVLGLWHGERLVALVSLVEEPEPLAEQFLASASAGGLRTVLAGSTDALAERLGVDDRWPASRVADDIRIAQAEGEVVMYASARAHRGLLASDVGIGVVVPGRRVPTGADLIVHLGLGHAWLLLEAVQRAREVSRRSALLAVAGASTGAGWALVGPGRLAASHLMLAVNASAAVSMATGALAGMGVAGTPMPRSPVRHRWHELSASAVLDLVASAPEGLSTVEHELRQRQELARLEPEELHLAGAVWEELANPLTPLLVAGAALSAAVGSITDAGLVLGVVGVNAGVGAVQRLRTERQLAELDLDGTSSVTLRTAEGPIVVPADQLVVGDVIELEAGDAVPADCRLLSGEEVEVDESSLTGESHLVVKSVHATPGATVAERACMLYEGTFIAAGDAVAVVVAVGADTEVGRSRLAAVAPPPSGVEQRLQRLTDVTIPVTIAAGVAATGLGFLFRRPTREAIGSGVSLTVAAVPEGLPAVATLAQVASARRLASRHALVRNPRAIEALGRVQQVCFDKTGTLTEGRLSLALVSDGDEEWAPSDLPARGRDVLRMARWATPAVNGSGALPHATDQAVHVAAEAHDLDDASTGWVRLADLPFESRRAMHAVLGRRGPRGRRLVAVKGAPETVLPRCQAWRAGGQVRALDPEALRELEEHIHRLGRRGLRVLVVASAPVPAGAVLTEPDDLPPLVVEGFVAISDPVRPAAAAAVALLQGAGVHLAMITGDHPSTAEAIAAELGMLNGSVVLTGVDIDGMADDELDRVIGDTAVFARVTPLQKVRIVAAYQRIGRPVAMTGDGANDAAAIRLADAGIALGGRGSDAARASADVVVTDDRIETIVDAVVEGRAMWESVRGAVAILVGGNLGEMGFTLTGAALGGQAPLNPRQLLLVNLLTDLAPALAIALREPDVSPDALLRAGPDASLGPALLRDIAVRATTTASAATVAYGIARFTGTPTRARTVGLATLVGTQLAQTVVAGGTRPTVLAATGLSVGALVVAVQTPGVSQFFGCRPLGPVGWTLATTTSLGATATSIALPWVGDRIGEAALDAGAGLVRRLPPALTWIPTPSPGAAP